MEKQKLLNKASETLGLRYSEYLSNQPTGYEEEAVTIVKNILSAYDCDLTTVNVMFMTEIIDSNSIMDAICPPAGRCTHIREPDDESPTYQIIWVSERYISRYGWETYRHVLAHEAAHAVTAQLYDFEQSADGHPTFERVCREVGAPISPDDLDVMPEYMSNLEQYLD